MGMNTHKRINSTILEKDRETLRGLRLLSDYAPTNPALSLEAISMTEEKLRQAEDAEARARHVLDELIDETIAAGRELHERAKLVRAGVVSQYGENSNAVQSVGRKKRVDYRRPTRRPHNPLENRQARASPRCSRGTQVAAPPHNPSRYIGN